MNYSQAMRELKKAGTAQNRKVYARHGVREPMFGVSYANLGKLKKTIKMDHDLALRLWQSGNHDARLLATMIADPAAVRSSELDAWARDLDSYPIVDAFSGLVARSSFADSKIRKWTKARREFVSQAGWNLVASRAMKDESLPAKYFEPFLEIIERNIGKAPNRTRYAMNNALIAIGLKSAGLEKRALAVARRIGKVEVDHGETGCKTPDAADYIRQVKGRRAVKARKA